VKAYNSKLQEKKNLSTGLFVFHTERIKFDVNRKTKKKHGEERKYFTLFDSENYLSGYAPVISILVNALIKSRKIQTQCIFLCTVC